ncbi:MAG: hypothetical protein HC836_34355 [Richelia sp. RM2_1_2]|nr:hypothetical protein [Richelia sp. RM2_1_2]
MGYALVMERQRKNRTFKIDELVIEGLNKFARTQNMSANKTLETHLFNFLQEQGLIDKNAELLGETRGGDQKSDKARSEDND